MPQKHLLLNLIADIQSEASLLQDNSEELEEIIEFLPDEANIDFEAITLKLKPFLSHLQRLNNIMFKTIEDVRKMTSQQGD